MLTCRQLSLADATQPLSVFLSTLFLAGYGRVDPDRSFPAYDLSLRIGVPDYRLGGRLWTDAHYEGATLFQGGLLMEVGRPGGDDTLIARELRFEISCWNDRLRR